MLNITPKDKQLLSSFCHKNPFITFEFRVFKSSDDRAFYLREFRGAEEIFIRREYDGSETYLYLFEDSCPQQIFTEKNWRKLCKENGVVISSDDDFLTNSEEKGGK